MSYSEQPACRPSAPPSFPALHDRSSVPPFRLAHSMIQTSPLFRMAREGGADLEAKICVIEGDLAALKAAPRPAPAIDTGLLASQPEQNGSHHPNCLSNVVPVSTIPCSTAIGAQEEEGRVREEVRAPLGPNTSKPLLAHCLRSLCGVGGSTQPAAKSQGHGKVNGKAHEEQLQRVFEGTTHVIHCAAR